jgi:hypothetical protein
MVVWWIMVVVWLVLETGVLLSAMVNEEGISISKS